MEAASENGSCSDLVVPSSSQFLEDLDAGMLFLTIAASLVSLLTLVIYVEELFFMYRHLMEWKPRSHALWILAVYPMFSLTSMVSILMPRTATFNDLISALYLSMTVYYFCHMLIIHYGGKDKMSLRLANDVIPLASPPLCCCCKCLPSPSVTKFSLHILELLVYQFTIVRPFILYVTTIFVIDSGPYNYVGGTTGHASTWLTISNIIQSLSSVLAIYGNILVFKLSSNHLQRINVRPKFLCVQLVILFDSLQRTILSVFLYLGMITCSPPYFTAQAQMLKIQHYLLIFEMFILSVIARIYYRRALQRAEMSPEEQHVTERKHISTMTSADDIIYGTVESAAIIGVTSTDDDVTNGIANGGVRSCDKLTNGHVDGSAIIGVASPDDVTYGMMTDPDIRSSENTEGVDVLQLPAEDSIEANLTSFSYIRLDSHTDNHPGTHT